MGGFGQGMTGIPNGRRVVIHMGDRSLGLLQTPSPPFLRELPGVQLWREKNNLIVESRKKRPLLKSDLTQVKRIPQGPNREHPLK